MKFRNTSKTQCGEPVANCDRFDATDSQSRDNYGIIVSLKELNTMPHIIPIRDLKNTANISQMCKESDEPIYITKNGYGDMVIMSMKVYREKLMMLDIYEKLLVAEDEIKAGKITEARISLAEMRKKYEL